jgi:bifunctional non-homologous end joining protein LigD
MASTKRLPDFIAPMLATSAEPFDSPDHLFAIKWDDTRALLFVEADGYRIVDRRRFAIGERYPELEFLGELAPGTVLDGEIVVLRDGRPDFTLLLSREQSGSSLRRRSSAIEYPATFIAFDQLYSNYNPGNWVEPGLYCTVTYHERTKSGQLRAPVFKELVDE